MTPQESYDHVVTERRYCHTTIWFNVTVVALGLLFFVVTVAAKGWQNTYLLTFAGFGTIVFLTVLRYREMRMWDRILDTLNDTHPHLGEKHDH